MKGHYRIWDHLQSPTRMWCSEQPGQFKILISLEIIIIEMVMAYLEPHPSLGLILTMASRKDRFTRETTAQLKKNVGRICAYSPSAISVLQNYDHICILLLQILYGLVSLLINWSYMNASSPKSFLSSCEPNLRQRENWENCGCLHVYNIDIQAQLSKDSSIIFVVTFLQS